MLNRQKYPGNHYDIFFIFPNFDQDDVRKIS